MYALTVVSWLSRLRGTFCAEEILETRKRPSVWISRLSISWPITIPINIIAQLLIIPQMYATVLKAIMGTSVAPRFRRNAMSTLHLQLSINGVKKKILHSTCIQSQALTHAIL
jgi:hypothetical protein